MTDVKYYLLFFPLLAMLALSQTVYASDGNSSIKELTDENLSNGNLSSENLSLGGFLNNLLLFNYIKDSADWVVDYPVYGALYLIYKRGIMEVKSGLQYSDSIKIDELYIKGGDKKSYIKLGKFLENWNIAKSSNTLISFSNHDDSYPNNIFYIKKFLTSPALKMSFSKENFTQQFLIAQKENTTDINHQTVGFKSSVDNKDSSIILGVIRKIGFPPTNYFLQLKGAGDDIKEWFEVSLIHDKSKRDKWSGVLGVEKFLDNNAANFEIIFNEIQNLLFIDSDLYVRKDVMFRLSFYLSLNDWSTSWNGAFDFLINKMFEMELGGYLFLGKNGKYFSPNEATKENNNNLYMKLGFTF